MTAQDGPRPTRVAAGATARGGAVGIGCRVAWKAQLNSATVASILEAADDLV